MLSLEHIESFWVNMLKKHLSCYGRRASTAIEAKDAIALWHLMEKRKPKRILEMGSGFSTWVIRKWAWAQEHDVVVWTLDTEWKWLGTVLVELEQLHLSTEHCLHYDSFMSCLRDTVAHFDLIFVDHGPCAKRVEDYNLYMSLLAPGGVAVFDNWHLPHYHTKMQPLLEADGFEIEDLSGDSSSERWTTMATRE